MIELRSGRLLVVIDERTGSIARIEDRKTRLVHLDARADARLFRVMSPRPGWSGRYADSHEGEPPRVLRKGNTLVLTYRNLKARGESTRITATATIQPRPSTEEVLFTLKLHNGGHEPINEIVFPRLGGWTGLGGASKDTMILGAHAQFDPHSLPLNLGLTYGRFHQRTFYRYPQLMYAPWIDLSGPDGGLSYINYMREPLIGGFGIENLAGYGSGLRLAFGWVYSPVIHPGETWSSPPIGIAVHSGDWHETADRYREWMTTWFKRPRQKRALREMIGFQNVLFRGFDGTPVRNLDTIPQAAVDGRHYGVDHLCVWDYVTLGNYSKHDDLDLLDYTPQEWKTVTKGLQRVRAEGTNASALINFRLCSPTLSLFKNGAHREIIRNYDGSPHTESFPTTHHHAAPFAQGIGPNSYACSPFAKTYRARVLRQTRQYCQRGYTSMFFDQPFEPNPDYGHPREGRPEHTYREVLSLVKEVRQILLANNSSAYLIGEYCEAFASQYIDLWMAWYNNVNPAIRSAYSLPHTMHSWVVDTNIPQASHAFALGMYLCLCTHGNEATLAEEPAFAAHVAALARLRKATAPRTAYARFNDTRGLQLRGSDSVVAYRFESARGPAVILAALGKRGRARVTLDWHPPRKRAGTLLRLDGRQESIAKPDTLEVKLNANEVAVWLP